MLFGLMHTSRSYSISYVCSVSLTVCSHCFLQLARHFLLYFCMKVSIRAKNWQISFVQFLAKSKKTNKQKQNKRTGEFSHYLKTFTIKFSETKIYIAINISMQIPDLAKFWFLNYMPKCSSPVNDNFDSFFFLMDSLS